MHEIIIHIYESSDEGYCYDIYRDEEALSNCDPIDGGLCTTTIENALEMATQMALEIISKVGNGNMEQKTCDKCASTDGWNNSSGDFQCENCGYDEGQDAEQ